MELEGRNWCVYDLEIANPIDGKECTWSTYHRMGLSVGCIYDYCDGDYKVYLAGDVYAMAERLSQADLVIGFNIKGFDDNLLSALVPTFDKTRPRYDLLEESRLGTGWTPDKPFPKGLNLDSHLQATFGKEFMKTNNGAEAPWLFRTGRMGELITYNIADVKREKRLFEHAVTTGYVKAVGRDKIPVRHPEALLPVKSA